LDEALGKTVRTALEWVGHKTSNSLLRGSTLGLKVRLSDNRRAIRFGHVLDSGKVRSTLGSKVLSRVSAQLTHKSRELCHRSSSNVDLVLAGADGFLDNGDQRLVANKLVTSDAIHVNRCIDDIVAVGTSLARSDLEDALRSGNLVMICSAGRCNHKVICDID
jgi:hypothetical protein